MNTRTLILAAALCAPHGATAQSPEERAVMAVVNRMFDGMRAADSAVVRAAFANGARFAMIDARTPPAAVRYDTVGGWIRGINAISLLKDAAGWKITQLSDTRRREACRDPLGTGPAAAPAPPPTPTSSQTRTQNVILVVTEACAGRNCSAARTPC